MITSALFSFLLQHFAVSFTFIYSLKKIAVLNKIQSDFSFNVHNLELI